MRARIYSHHVTCPPLGVNWLMNRLSTRHSVLRPPLSSRPNTYDYGPQVHTILASKCISKLTWLHPPTSLDYSLQVHPLRRLITSSKWISKLAPLRPQCASPHSLNHHLGVPISKLARAGPPSVSPNSLDHDVGVYLWVHSIIIVRRTSNSSQSLPAASPDMPGVDG